MGSGSSLASSSTWDPGCSRGGHPSGEAQATRSGLLRGSSPSKPSRGSKTKSLSGSSGSTKFFSNPAWDPGVISIDDCTPPPKGYQRQIQLMCRYAEDIPLLVKPATEIRRLNLGPPFDHDNIRIFYMEGFHDMLVLPELSHHMESASKRAVSHLEKKYDVDALRIDLPLFSNTIDIIASCFFEHGRPSELMLSERDKGAVDCRGELPKLFVGRSVHSPGGVFTPMFEKEFCAGIVCQ